MSSRSGDAGGPQDPSEILVGRVRAAFGIRGEVMVEVISDVPQRFARGGAVRIGGALFHVQGRRPTPKGLIVKFREVESRNAAEELRGASIHVSLEDVPPPPPDTYYHYQILDMRVVTVEGEELGVVAEILETGANDVYVVKGQGKEVLIPAIAEVVKEVDAHRRVMVVDLSRAL